MFSINQLILVLNNERQATSTFPVVTMDDMESELCRGDNIEEKPKEMRTAVANEDDDDDEEETVEFEIEVISSAASSVTLSNASDDDESERVELEVDRVEDAGQALAQVMGEQSETQTSELDEPEEQKVDESEPQASQVEVLEEHNEPPAGQVEPEEKEEATIDNSAADADEPIGVEEPEVEFETIDGGQSDEVPQQLSADEGGKEVGNLEIAPSNDLINVEQQIDCPPPPPPPPSDIASSAPEQPTEVELSPEVESEAHELVECPRNLEFIRWRSLSDDWLIVEDASELVIEQLDKLISLSTEPAELLRVPIEVEIEQQHVDIQVSAAPSAEVEAKREVGKEVETEVDREVEAPQLQVILNEPNDDDGGFRPRSCSPSTPGGGGGAHSPSSHEFGDEEELSRRCFGSISSLTGGYEDDDAGDDDNDDYVDDYEDSLEREFDQEPEFERREVVVKRNRELRDEYTLGAELGRGKFGTVYRCSEVASGRQLAAKFITMRRREDREDVEREVAIMSVLQHKRLLQLYDAFDDGQLEMCLITELVEGGELFERIVDDDFDLTERKAAIFMRQICEGVEYMQGENIVHLDMKPENILCLSRTSARIKLIDFGLARRLEPGKPIRVMFGTPDFAAPEVLAYEQVTLATDMWSVGVICYVLLSGLSPFMGDSDLDTMANVTRATYDFNDQAFEPISELAKDFISKLLVRAPEQRLKPSECLAHPWLARGAGRLAASLAQQNNNLPIMMSDQRRRSSVASLGLHRLAMEQVAAIASAAAATTQQDHHQHHNRPHRASFGAESSASSGAISLDKRRLKRYVVRRKWHKTVHAIMALNRMGARLSAQLSG